MEKRLPDEREVKKYKKLMLNTLDQVSELIQTFKAQYNVIVWSQPGRVEVVDLVSQLWLGNSSRDQLSRWSSLSTCSINVKKV